MYTDAATSMTNREEMLDAAAELIEKDLELLGATAIEDKLQVQDDPLLRMGPCYVPHRLSSRLAFAFFVFLDT